MTREFAFIAVGSNIEPLIHIPRALDRLKQLEHVQASSTFYQTEPLGPPNQPVFVNGVWCIETQTSPHHVKTDILTGIERQLGRIRTDDKYAPRTIDLDLILYGRRHCDDPNLTLPHPDLVRPFVLGPLWELIDTLGLTHQLGDILTDPPSAASIGTPLPQLTRQLRVGVPYPE